MGSLPLTVPSPLVANQELADWRQKLDAQVKTYKSVSAQGHPLWPLSLPHSLQIHGSADSRTGHSFILLIALS